MKRNRKLVRQQLEATLGRFRPLLDISAPPKGWIRAIRDALGMSGRQLAERVGVTKQRTAVIEKQELTGTATLNTLHKIAEALDCVFVYGFVPRTSLEETVRNRALRVARTRLVRVSQSMRLEDQALSQEEDREILSDMVGRLVDELPANLWDES
jgi:predicted DNA-binding mobile mystery protein A